MPARIAPRAYCHPCGSLECCHRSSPAPPPDRVAGDLGDISQKLLIEFCGRKITLDQIFRLFRLPVCFCQAVGAALTPDGQGMLPADMVDSPGAAGIAPVQSEPADDTPDPVVFPVFLVLPQTGAGDPAGLAQDAAASRNTPLAALHMADTGRRPR